MHLARDLHVVESIAPIFITGQYLLLLVLVP